MTKVKKADKVGHGYVSGELKMRPALTAPGFMKMRHTDVGVALFHKWRLKSCYLNTGRDSAHKSELPWSDQKSAEVDEEVTSKRKLD